MKKRAGSKVNKVFSVLTLAVLAVAIIFGLLMIANSFGITGDVIGIDEAIESFGSDWVQGDIGVGVAKVMFTGIIFILILSVFMFIGLFEGSGGRVVSVILAFLITFLSTAYLTPQEVYSSLLGYTSLALALNIVLPFFILLFGSIMFMSKAFIGGGRGKKSLKLFSTVAKMAILSVFWFAYVIYMAFRTIGSIFGGTSMAGAGQLSYPVLLAHLAILTFSVFFIVKQNWFVAKLGGWAKEVMKIQAQIEGAQIQTNAQVNAVARVAMSAAERAALSTSE